MPLDARTLCVLDSSGGSPLALQLCRYAALVHTAGSPSDTLIAHSTDLVTALAAVEHADMQAAIEQSGVTASSLMRVLRHADERVVDVAGLVVAALSGQGRHTTTLELQAPDGGEAILLKLIEQPCTSCEGHGYGRKIWRASRTASAVCTGGVHVGVRGRRVLEVGSGAGAPGIACAVAGAEVVLSDWDAVALGLAAESATLNGVAGRVRTAILDWSAPEDSELASAPPFDVVVAADVVYELEHAPRVAHVLQRFLAPRADARAVVVLDADRSRMECAWRGVEAFAAAAVAQEHPLRCVHAEKEGTVYTFVFAHRER